MTITELHAEWMRLGALACVKASPTAYAELKAWEAAHAAQWDNLIAHDLEKKRISLVAEQETDAGVDLPTGPVPM